MNDFVLYRLFFLTAGVSVVFLCFWHTERWSLGSAFLVAYSRFNVLVLILVFFALVGPSLVGSVSVPLERLVMVLGQGSTRSVVRVPAPVTGSGEPTRTSHVSGMSVLGGPSLSVAFVDQVLAVHHSPAVGTGSVFYALSERYGVDDAFALAFFWHESNFGVNGEARVTHSLGNLRCIAGADCVDQDRGGYASFPDWASGCEAWYTLIRGPLYVGSGRLTVETIIPRYAPSADHNNERGYIANVIWVVTQLRVGRLDF